MYPTPPSTRRRLCRTWLASLLSLFVGLVLLGPAAPVPAHAAPSGSLQTKSVSSTVLNKISSTKTSPFADAVITVPAKLPAKVGFQLRSKGSQTGYRTVLEIASNGDVTGSFLRMVKGKSTAVGKKIPLRFNARPGDRVRLQASVAAMAKVKLYLRAWNLDSTQPKQPTKWQMQGTDSSKKRLKSAGTVYLFASGAKAKVSYKVVAVKKFSAAKAAKIGVKAPTAAAVELRDAVAPTSYTLRAGVTRGTKLTRRVGDITVTKPGTVLSNLDIVGYVKIKADNVTIKNSIIRGGDKPTTVGRGLVMNIDGAKNLRIVDTTLVATSPSIDVEGVMGSDLTLERVDISNVVDAVKVIKGGRVTVKDSWLHGAYHAKDSRASDGVTHDDAIQVQGGTNTVITGNVIESYHNAAIMVTQDEMAVNGLRIEGNRISGGACSVNLSEKGKGAMRGVRIVGNQFGPGQRAGLVCPIVLPDTTKAVAEVSGNTWIDSGQPALPKRGT